MRYRWAKKKKSQIAHLYNKYGFSAQLKLSPFPSIVLRNVPYANGILGFFHSLFILSFIFNIILKPNVLIRCDMYISKRFSSEVKSTKVTQKMDKIVSVTNKNIYRESLLTSSKLENFIKIKRKRRIYMNNIIKEKMPRDWHFHLIIIYIFEIFCFLFNEYQAWIKLYKESWFQRKVKWGYGEIGRRYGLDCAETQWKLIIVNLFQSNIEESPILHCDKNSMNLMLFIK
ncbi:hypothetical protein ACJX0J_004284 [Zea mays]